MDLTSMLQRFAEPFWLYVSAAIILVGVVLCVTIARRRPMAVPSVLLRSVALACITVALAGPLTGRINPHAEVMFIVDVSDSIAENAVSVARQFINTAISGGTNVLTTFIAIALVDKIGRKPLLMFGSIGMMISPRNSSSFFCRAVSRRPILAFCS